MAYAIIVHTYKVEIYEIEFFQVWKTAETGNLLQKEVTHLAQHFWTPAQNIAFHCANCHATPGNSIHSKLETKHWMNSEREVKGQKFEI